MADGKGSENEKNNLVVLNRGNSYVIKIHDNFFNIEKSDWDTKILGINFYRINDITLKNPDKLNESLKSFKSRFDIDCLTYKTDLNNLDLMKDLMRGGFILAGFPIRLSVDLENMLFKDDENIRLFKEGDLSHLLQIAKNAFLHT